MNRSNLLRRLVGGISVIAVVAIITFSGCTNIDKTLGSDLTLESQGMKIGQMNFSGLTPNGNNYFDSRLYKTDSLSTSGLSYGYFGMMANDTFGTRSAAFFTQYVAGNSLNDDGFGYMPIFDSAVLYLSVDSYGGDTTIKQQFEVFEVIDNSFLTESKDTMFFPTFDITPFIDEDKPVFTFTYPDADNEVYVASTSVTMKETDYTADFMERLMLVAETDEYDKDIYDDTEAWVEQFKGLYIRPVEDLKSVNEGSEGAIFGTKLESSGFGFFARNREESDNTLIKDTVGMSYLFYYSYAEHGNVAISVLDNDYDGSLINMDDVMTPEKSADDVPLTSTLRVEAMSGVVSRITLAPEFFEELDKILDAEEAASGNIYTSLFFNQAKMKIYMEDITGYNPADVDPFIVTPWMNYMPTSLGMYLDYSSYSVTDEDGVERSTMTGIADYAYAYESSTSLDYGGALNRSWGCYVMNISSYIQTVWNNYLKAKAKAEDAGGEIDWDSIEGRSIYLGPTASNLFTFKYASLQAGNTEDNGAPIYLDLTYTMIR